MKRITVDLPDALAAQLAAALLAERTKKPHASVSTADIVRLAISKLPSAVPSKLQPVAAAPSPAKRQRQREAVA